MRCRLVRMTGTRQTDNPLLQQLVWVHDGLRRDLASCRELAEAARAGAEPAVLRDELGRLRRHGPLFQLGVDCLQYCRLVHAHHGAEDAELFPLVRRSAPRLAAAVDRLEADHRTVSDLLDTVEAEARALEAAGASEGDEARTRLVDALTQLSSHLLDHLEREERVLAPVFATWPTWPPE